MKVRVEIRWPLLIVGLLLLAALANVILVVKATGDPSHSVEPNYYAKALRWNEKMAQDRENAKLGWRLYLNPTADPHRLSVSLTDRTGQGIDDAAVRLTAFHKARSRRPIRITLQEHSGGTCAHKHSGHEHSGGTHYWADIGLARPGLWELRFVVEQNGKRFTQTVEHEVAPRLGMRPGKQ